MADVFPLIPVVVIHWQDFGPTQRCIDSIARSEGVRPHLILVCHDVRNREEIDLKIPPHLPYDLLLDPKNRGFSGGMNRGIEKALEKNTDWIFLLNNDAAVERTTLSTLLKATAEQCRVSIVSPVIRTIHDPAEIQVAGGYVNLSTGRIKHSHQVPQSSKTWIPVQLASGCAMLIATDCLKKWGGFDERYFAYFEDAEICLRYRREGGRVGIVPSASVLHEAGKGDPIRFYYNVRNHFLILSDYATDLSPPLAQLRTLAIVLRYLAFLVLRRPCPVVPGIAMIWHGYRDYRKARWGRFEAK